MNQPKFTIITVCYNVENTIESTIQSVLKQTYKDFEYIIQDGDSKDRTLKMISEGVQNDQRVHIYSNKDFGIYDAMNIALEKASGEYVLFLNVGDKFTNDLVLENVWSRMKNQTADIFYGNVNEISNQKIFTRYYTKKNAQIWYYSLGACLCHQAMFCKRNLFTIKKFDLDYKVCADKEWQLFHLENQKIAVPLEITVADVLVEGYSTMHVDDLVKETEQIIKKYCGCYYILYWLLIKMKKSNAIHKLMISVEKMISGGK